MPEFKYDSAIWSDIVHLLPAWTWETDGAYRLSYIHMPYAQMADFDTSKLMGLSILEKQGNEAGLDAYLDALLAQGEIDSFCYERGMVNGEKLVLMDSAIPKFDADGTFAGYRGVSLNLTAVLRQADHSATLIGSLVNRNEALEVSLTHLDAKMQASNKLLTEVVDSMGEGLMVTSGTEAMDDSNRIIMVNPAYLSLFGLDASDIKPDMRVKDYLEMLIAQGDMAQSRDSLLDVNAALAAGERVLMEIPRSGRCFYTRATTRRSGGYVLVHSDVTDLEQQNRALREARDAAEVANRTKSSFLANMSHEIRTPMNGVIGIADLLSETRLTSEQAEYVETIRNSAMALTTLITDILDFSKVEAGRMELTTEAFNLHNLIAETTDLLTPLATSKGLTLTRLVGADVPEVIMGDPLRLRQVILNILGNAVKFTQRGQVHVFVGGGAALTLEVSDTGIGIPEDRLPHIFNAFEQVTSGQNREFEGTGLGLSITQQLVHAMEGTCEVTSQVGQGSTFTLTLPLVPASLSEIAAETVDWDAALPETFSVLLVEDNKTNQLVVQRMLERRGAAVTTVETGRDALACFAPELFDIVLMDISMPEMTGLEATQILRQRQAEQHWPHRPIVALTGNAFQKDRTDALEAGMDDFLTKPVRREMLVRTVAEQLAKHSAEWEEPTSPATEALSKRKNKN